MHVTHLSLTDFRSYPSAEVPLGPGVTTIVGPNGQGKTNLVEALGYVATLGSHRVATDAPLVRAGAERAVVRAAVDRAGRSTLVELEITPGRANRARVNRAPVPRPREVLGALRTVLFAPEDLSLVKGEPEGRRRFLDELLVALAPRYAGVRADYDRVLKQRNALLKSAGATRAARKAAAELPTLEIWDSHLAVAGAELLAARLHLVHRLMEPVQRAYHQVSDDPGEALLGYRWSLPGDPPPAPPGRDELAGALLSAMSAARPQEVERGASLVGPHRDDLVLTLGDLPAKGYASHGESWSFALALRLASYVLLRGGERVPGSTADPQTEPVLVLDDVFAELDTGRRARLAEIVAGAEQVLVTAAVDDDVPVQLDGPRLQVRAGEVVGG